MTRSVRYQGPAPSAIWFEFADIIAALEADLSEKESKKDEAAAAETSATAKGASDAADARISKYIT